MLFEEILLVLLGGGIGVFMIGLPTYKLIRSVIPAKRNPLKEAQERLELARLEAEAAKLNKKTEKVYEDIYHETLEEDDIENEKHRRL